jgi:alpha-beta hydrolase superfamily lysophospholipase
MSKRQVESIRLPLLSGGSLQAHVSYVDANLGWAVLYVHGFGSTRGGVKAEALEAACASRGWTFASFDFRGHGESTGSLLELRGTGLLEDLEAMHDYFVGRGIPKVCLVGSSMGGWAAAWFTLRHPSSVIACALIAPALHFLESRWALLNESERQRWKQTGRIRYKSDYVDVEVGYGLAEEIPQFPAKMLAEDLQRPLLIFHGMGDEVVPYQQTIDFVAQARLTQIELRLYKYGDHRLLALKDEMADSACRFFEKALHEDPRVGP